MWRSLRGGGGAVLHHNLVAVELELEANQKR